jgi:hypothetical protein
MRIGRGRECGDLLMFDEVRRRLSLGMPQHEGFQTIRLADIVGTFSRAGDFDGCWRPRDADLAHRIDQIRTKNAEALNEPIEVIRVDRAYFVVDGHKRVSSGRADGREFIDASVSVAASAYDIAPGVDSASIASTGLEQRFRESTGLLEAVPGARFAVSEPEGYAELQEALEAYAFDLSQRLGRLLDRREAAALWYECVYVPTVQAAVRIRPLLRQCTEADLFLTLHRQSRRLWGTECRVAQDEADRLVRQVLAEMDPDPSIIGRLVDRARRRRPPPRLLDQHR